MKKLITMFILMLLTIMSVFAFIGCEDNNADSNNFINCLEFVSNGDGTCNATVVDLCRDEEAIIPSVSPSGDIVTGIDFTSASLNLVPIRSITVPASIKSISDVGFSYCYGVEEINVDENNSEYKSIDGNLYTKDGKTLIRYSSGKTDTSFAIPAGVETIGSHAFLCAHYLKKIEIPDSVTVISEEAFESCTSLLSLKIGAGVHTIGEYAFGNCGKLTDIYYNGTKSLWDLIYIGDENENLFSSKHYYKSE